MTAHSRSRRARRAAAKLATIRAFVAGNRVELARIMKIAGGEAGAADAEILFRLLALPRPKVEEILAALAQMRDALSEAEAGVGSDDPDARPDLDAAIRWHGARLDDVLGQAGR